MANLRRELRSYIVSNYLFGLQEKFQDSDSLWELGLMDSTGVLELISHLEEKYSITFEPNEIIPDNLDSIDNLVRFVEGKLRRFDPAHPVVPGLKSPGASQ